MSNPSNQVPDHLSALLQFEKKYEYQIKKSEDVEQKLQAEKDHLLNSKQKLVAVNCSLLASKIAKISAEIRKINERISQAQREIRKIKVLINANMTGYINKFICLSDMTPQIIELLEERGIDRITIANNSNISELKRTADEPPVVADQSKRSVDEPVPVIVVKPVVFQPEETDDELMPVLVPEEQVENQEVDEKEYSDVVDDDDQTFLVPEEQEDVPSSVEDCAAHLREMVIEFEQQMEMYQDDRLEIERAYDATKGSGPSIIRNTLDSFNSYIRVAQINHQLEMIEYVKKNVPDDQLTIEIFDYLDSRKQPFKKPVTVASFKQMKFLEYLVNEDNKLKENFPERNDITDKLNELIEQEEAKGNWQKAERYKQIISEREHDYNGSLDKAWNDKALYAKKYCPEQKTTFFLENLQDKLSDLIADANDQKFLASEKTLRDRLVKLEENLLEEHDQVISSIQSTSTSVNINDYFETFVVESKNDDREEYEDDGADFDVEMEDGNGNETDKQS